MKHTQKLVNGLVACAVALAMGSTLTAQTANERIAKVVRVKGGARFTTGGNVWQPVEAGTRLKAGAIIQTAADSYVDIVLDEAVSGAAFTVPSDAASPEGGPSTGGGLAYQPIAERDVVRVFAESVLAIDKLTRMDTGADQVTVTHLDLRSGKIFGTVKKLSAASSYEVRIPNGVAGIRGTSYMISADGVVSVFSGSVVISFTGPGNTVVTQVVMGGFQFNVHTGKLLPLAETEQPNAPPPPAEFEVDHTIYYVAPIPESVSPSQANVVKPNMVGDKKSR